MADQTTPAAESTTVETTKVETRQAPDGFKSEESKSAVLADLAKERDARKALEAEVQKLKDGQQVIDKLATVFSKDGDKPEPEAIPAWAEQLIRERDEAKAKEQRTETARSIAKDAGITDVDDLALIAAQPTDDAMKALAARLAAVANAPSRPRPDRSAGRSGESNGRPGSVSEARAAYRERTTKNA